MGVMPPIRKRGVHSISGSIESVWRDYVRRRDAAPPLNLFPMGRCIRVGGPIELGIIIALAKAHVPPITTNVQQTRFVPPRDAPVDLKAKAMIPEILAHSSVHIPTNVSDRRFADVAVSGVVPVEEDVLGIFAI